MYNKLAMDALCNNDLFTAQTFFRKEAKESKSYEAYNNLGVFYTENGTVSKNEKIRSAGWIGKYYLTKALAIKPNVKTLNKLGHWEYDHQNYLKALKYWQQSYSLERNEKTLFNMVVSLYNARQYAKVCDICLQSSPLKGKFYPVYALSLCKLSSPSVIKQMIEKKELSFDFIEDEIDAPIYWFYYAGMYKEVVEYERRMKDECCALGEDDLCILIDSYVRIGQYNEGKMWILEHYAYCYDEALAKKLEKTICCVFDNARLREKMIRKTRYRLPLDEICCYFGCPIHST